MTSNIFDRETAELYSENSAGGKAAVFLYNNPLGRLLLSKIFIKRFVTNVSSLYFYSPLSVSYIKKFIDKADIDMSRYKPRKCRCFNDFFIRKIKNDKLLIDQNQNSLISPCDAKLTAYKIENNLEVSIKGGRYTMESLLKNSSLASEFANGYCLVFRLSVDDYHRYCFVDDGFVGENSKIDGSYHTVGRVSDGKFNVYSENSREYTELFTDNFGKIIQMEVGAMMVGRIKNRPHVVTFKKGDEKGYFCFGGSTVIVFLRENAAKIDADILELSRLNIETKIKIGEKIGEKYIT